MTLSVASLAAIIASPLAGQDSPDEMKALRSEIEQLQRDSVELEEAHRLQLEQLQQQLRELERRQAEMAAEGTPRPADEARWAPAPVPGAEESFIDISAIGTFSVGTSTEHHVEDLQGGAHDPQKRGFNVQSLELAMSGIVDPYFRAQANLIFNAGGHGHGGEAGPGVELEEAFLETLALPGNLQVRGGQFFTEFGRHNTRHLHAWEFVDQPLVNSRMFGPEGLRNPGARVSWLAPTPFYSELFLAVQNSTGETAYSFRNPEGFDEGLFRPVAIDEEEAEEIGGLKDLLYSTRYAASVDLADAHTLLAGVSAAFGPNAPTEETGVFAASDPGRTEIYGADFYWRWTPADQAWGFPFVGWQTEAMLRRFHMRNPGETFEDYGFYSQLTYGFTRSWVAGLRYDWVRGDMRDLLDSDGEELEFPDRWRISPNLTYYPSEFSKIRLQYNYDERAREEVDHSVWLQFEFSIGPHGAHTF